MANLFHLTSVEAAPDIERDGLTANSDGEIFTFTDMIVADVIAKEQVFLKRYVVFQIDRHGITGRIRRDNVAEWSAGYQRIIQQQRIKAKHVTRLGEFKIASGPNEFDYLKGERLGQTRAQVDAKFEVFQWMEEQRGKMPNNEIANEANRRLQAIVDEVNTRTGEQMKKRTRKSKRMKTIAVTTPLGTAKVTVIPKRKVAMKIKTQKASRLHDAKSHRIGLVNR